MALCQQNVEDAMVIRAKLNVLLDWMPCPDDGSCCHHCIFYSSDQNCPKDENGKELCDKGYFVLNKVSKIKKFDY